MDDDFGGIIGLVLILAAIAFVIYCVVMLASIIAAVAGAGGIYIICTVKSVISESHYQLKLTAFSGYYSIKNSASQISLTAITIIQPVSRDNQISRTQGQAAHGVF